MKQRSKVSWIGSLQRPIASPRRSLPGMRKGLKITLSPARYVHTCIAYSFVYTGYAGIEYISL